MANDNRPPGRSPPPSPPPPPRIVAGTGRASGSSTAKGVGVAFRASPGAESASLDSPPSLGDGAPEASATGNMTGGGGRVFNAEIGESLNLSDSLTAEGNSPSFADEGAFSASGTSDTRGNVGTHDPRGTPARFVAGDPQQPPPVDQTPSSKFYEESVNLGPALFDSTLGTRGEDDLVSDGNSPPTYIGRRRRDGWPGHGDPPENAGSGPPGSPPTNGEVTSPDEPPPGERHLDAGTGEFEVTGADVRMSAPRAALERPPVPPEAEQGAGDEGGLPPGTQLFDNPALHPPRAAESEATLGPITPSLDATEAPDVFEFTIENGPGLTADDTSITVDSDAITVNGGRQPPPALSEIETQIALTGQELRASAGQLASSVEEAEIPSVRSAAIQPVWDENDRLVIPHTPAQADHAEAMIVDAFAAGRQGLETTLTFLRDNPGNCDRRLIGYGQVVLDLIPDSMPDQLQVFSLGRAVEKLSAIVDVDDMLNEIDKASLIQDLKSLKESCEAFPAWRDLKRTARATPLTPEQVTAAAELVQQLADELSAPGVEAVVDASVPDALRELVAPPETAFVLPIKASEDLLALDRVESALNIAIKLAERVKPSVVKQLNDFGGAFKKGMLKSTEAAGEHAMDIMFSLLTGVVATATLGPYGAFFAWAYPVIKAGKKVLDGLGKSAP